MRSLLLALLFCIPAIGADTPIPSLPSAVPLDPNDVLYVVEKVESSYKDAKVTVGQLRSYVLQDVSGVGTVTSVDLIAPDIFVTAGGPITSSGAIIFAPTNPGADRLVFFDVSQNKWVYLAPGQGLKIDGVEMNVDIPGLPIDESPDAANDSVMTYDASAGVLKRVALNKLPGAASQGTVTSITLTAAPSSVFGVTGGTITDSGTIAITLNNQVANSFLAGPGSGGPAIPGFRQIVDVDLPSLFTRDSEWNSTAKINLATTDDNFATLLGAETLQNKTLAAPAISGAITMPPNIRQTFKPGANVAGLNVGSVAVLPDTPSNFDIVGLTTDNHIYARMSGAWYDLTAAGSGSGGGGGGASTNSHYLLYGATDALLPNALVLAAGSGITIATNGTNLVLTAAAGGGGSVSTNSHHLLYGGTDPAFPQALVLAAGQGMAISTNGTNLVLTSSSGTTFTPTAPLSLSGTNLLWNYDTNDLQLVGGKVQIKDGLTVLLDHIESGDATERWDFKSATETPSTNNAVRIRDLPEDLIVPVTDQTSAITTGTKFVMKPIRSYSIGAVRITLKTGPSGGSITGDLEYNGTTIFSVKPNIEDGEKDSDDSASAPVLTSTPFAVARNGEFTFKVNSVSGTPTGLVFYIYAER
jgi:hypothetical protein